MNGGSVIETRIHSDIADGPKKLAADDVTITKCKTGVCKLRRNTNVEVELKFSPETDVQEMTTRVHANILELPFPFIGVDGTSACENVYAEDGVTKVNCPLKAGTPYVYKNSFPIKDFYPTIALTVHWALESQNKDLVCFEVPAKIV